MLLELRLRNFRSFRDQHSLKLTAAKDTAHSERLLATGNAGLPHVLPVVVIYGPNAGGKSNLLRAMIAMGELVTTSASTMQIGKNFNNLAFLFNSESVNQPVELEISFILEGVRYQYGFSFNHERIMEEWLLVYQTAKPSQWFLRRYDEVSGQDFYQFSTSLRGAKKIWQNATRPNALFLSTAVSLNCEPLKKIYLWIAGSFSAVPVFKSDLAKIFGNATEKEILNRILISADGSIDDVDLIARKKDHLHIEFDNSQVKLERGEKEFTIPLFRHVVGDTVVNMEVKEESSGVQKLLGLSGPLMDSLRQGQVLLVDELDSSLHPKLARQLIAMFHDPNINRHGAQLIFTTHNTSLLDANLFRRDQIWFVDKDRDHASSLYPLSDFSPRKNEALEKGYMEGRYGALPLLEGFEQIML